MGYGGLSRDNGDEPLQLPKRDYDCSDPDFARKEADRYNLWLEMNKEWLKRKQEKEAEEANVPPPVSEVDQQRLARALDRLNRIQDAELYHGLDLYAAAYIAMLMEGIASGTSWNLDFIKRIEDLLDDVFAAILSERTALKNDDVNEVVRTNQVIARDKALLDYLLNGEIEGYDRALYELKLSVAGEYLGAITALGGGIAAGSITSLLSTYLPRFLSIRGLPTKAVPPYVRRGASPGARPKGTKLAPASKPAVVLDTGTIVTPEQAEAALHEAGIPLEEGYQYFRFDPRIPPRGGWRVSKPIRRVVTPPPMTAAEEARLFDLLRRFGFQP